jgi:hypothetical protein
VRTGSIGSRGSVIGGEPVCRCGLNGPCPRSYLPPNGGCEVVRTDAVVAVDEPVLAPDREPSMWTPRGMLP